MYTALFGDYDDLHDIPKEGDFLCDYICFTDNQNLTSNTWEIKIVDAHLPPNMMNRMFKLLPHKYLDGYEASLYVDANFSLKQDLFHFMDSYLNSGDFMVPKHPVRSCIYSEGLACLMSGKVDFNVLVCQLKRYVEAGFPAEFGLAANSILLRRHNSPIIISFMNNWWKELQGYSQRDQLSFQYLVWKSNVKVGVINECVFDENNFFKLNPHKYSRHDFFSVFMRKLGSASRLLFYYPVYFFKVLRFI